MSEQTFTVVVTDKGEIGFFAENGTFEAGKVNLLAIIRDLGQSGFQFDEIGEVENHRNPDDKTLVRLHDTAHEGLHKHTR